MQTRIAPFQESDGHHSHANEATSSKTDTALSSIILIGTSFKTSSIEFREELSRALSGQSAQRHPPEGAKESTTLQTCNRIELYVVSGQPERTEGQFFSHLPARLRERRDCFYVLRGMDVITHLFELASGLDSMVVGEDQILSQLRETATKARLEGHLRAVLSMLFDVATSVGSRVRSTLDIPAENRSVSAFALKFALEKLGRKPNGVLLIGTGKVMKLAASGLSGCEIFVATRRKEVSPHFSLAKTVSYHEIGKVARRCDLIISATKQERYVIKQSEFSDDMRRVLLDLAFPRNMDPRLKNSRNIELYDLDDLAANKGAPSIHDAAFTKQARRMIEGEAARFARWLTASRLSPTIASLYRWAEDLRNSEIDFALRRLAGLSPRERRVVEAMSRRLVSKILAPAATFAKESSEKLSQRERLRILSEIFANRGDGQ